MGFQDLNSSVELGRDAEIDGGAERVSGFFRMVHRLIWIEWRRLNPGVNKKIWRPRLAEIMRAMAETTCVLMEVLRS